MSVQQFQEEVNQGQRFEFGKNWRNFLSVLDDGRIHEAEAPIETMLGSVEGKDFLDVGCGSGLFSLAVCRLGARRVHSLDYDPRSVECAQELRRRYVPGSDSWTIQQGSVLDTGYLDSLGTWAIVYSWGVLHHTGNMWAALQNVSSLVCPGGVLWISIYNASRTSPLWASVKSFYNRGRWQRLAVSAVLIPYLASRATAGDLVVRHQGVIRGFREYRRRRGMSRFHDWIDWLGGFPYEVASVEQIFDFYVSRGFSLERLATAGGGKGCNQFVFRKL